MILTIEAVQREDGRCALFHGDQFIGHLRMDATGTIGGIPLPPDISGLLEQRPETVGRMVTIPRRPAKKRASSRKATRTPRAPKEAKPAEEGARKMGRPPAPWFCRGCSNNTSGPECGFCGAKRPPAGER